MSSLTLKHQAKFVADDILTFSFFYFSEKTNLDISCELSAWQTIHMKCQGSFPSEKKKRKGLFPSEKKKKKKKKKVKIVICFSCDWCFKG